MTDEVIADFFAVMHAHEHAIRPDLDDLTLELVRSDLVSPHLDRAASGIWHNEQEPVMVAQVTFDDAARNVGIDAYALPTVDASVFALAFERGREFATAKRSGSADLVGMDELPNPCQPDARIWQLQMFCREEDARYRRFLEAQGLEHVRNFYRMTIALSDEHDQLEFFPGVELVPALTDELQRELKDLARETFREHWGSADVDRTFEEWKALRESGPGFSWERAWVVRLDGESAGLLINTDAYIADSTDYVWTLGVREEFRGRGLATWLLRKSFFDARQRGLAKVGLNVDAENSTGAVRLYESVGMRPTEVYVAYRAPVTRLLDGAQHP